MKKLYIAVFALLLSVQVAEASGVEIKADGTSKGLVDAINIVGVTPTIPRPYEATIDLSSARVFEGTTADGFELTLNAADPTADQATTLPNFAVDYALIGSTLTTNNIDVANSIWGVSNGWRFEGATADASEGTLSPADVTADRTWTLPDQSGTVHVSSGATALTAGASVTLTVQPGLALFTDTITTDNQDQTITFSGAGSAGDVAVIKFTTDAAGSGDEVITFHATLVNSTGTLTLANAAADVYVVSFISDGTKWNETSRTAIQVT